MTVLKLPHVRFPARLILQAINEFDGSKANGFSGRMNEPLTAGSELEQQYEGCRISKRPVVQGANRSAAIVGRLRRFPFNRASAT